MEPVFEVVALNIPTENLQTGKLESDTCKTHFVETCPQINDLRLLDSKLQACEQHKSTDRSAKKNMLEF